jgi:hypothetical protein
MVGDADHDSMVRCYSWEAHLSHPRRYPLCNAAKSGHAKKNFNVADTGRVVVRAGQAP